MYKKKIDLLQINDISSELSFDLRFIYKIANIMCKAYQSVIKMHKKFLVLHQALKIRI